MNSSDAHMAFACAKCGSLLAVQTKSPNQQAIAAGGKPTRKPTCISCNDSSNIKPIYLPYVFR